MIVQAESAVHGCTAPTGLPSRREVWREAAEANASYCWQSRMVAHHLCPTCGCATWSDSPAFEPDGSFEAGKCRIGANARLFDGFEAADWPVTVIDGRNLW